MRFLEAGQPVFPRAWQALVNRKNSDNRRLRRDPLTLKVFGKPMTVPQAVSQIIGDVAGAGDQALVRYSRLLEGVSLTPARLRVSEAERRRGEASLPQAVRRALGECAGHIRDYHQAQKPLGCADRRRPGVRVSERVRPLRRVGVYVPGGNAPLASTVLMNVIPARVAGVAEVVLATPPAADGTVPAAILAAARLAGVQEIYRLGGAAAVAAMALGTASLPRVDKIVGPGNAFVTEAKRQLVGQVGIDHLAGPSEILIVGDQTADPEAVTWDLLGQCEHGSGAVAVLLTPSRALLQGVQVRLAAAGKENAFWKKISGTVTLIQTRSLSQALQLANEYGPEHLSLQCRQPQAGLKQITNAGAVFLGAATPQALGDYTAGPNHVLPTGGTCRWASPLSVRDFLHYTSLVAYTPAGVRREGTAAAVVAETEGLRAHAASIRTRMRG